jgi:septum formation protein
MASKIILASQSRPRRALLKNAGIKFRVVPADIDEKKFSKGLKPVKAAQELAKRKALAMAAKHPGALVIGADQILECSGKIFTKAKNKKDAEKKLKLLRGKTHRLISAVCVVQDKKILWTHTGKAKLTMHDFDDVFLKKYTARAGPALTRAVGAYELEGAGAWLFKNVQGDHFTILGLPLLPLLKFLKSHGVKP